MSASLSARLSAAANGEPRAAPAGPASALAASLRLYRNPLRQLISASTWRATWYLLAYLVVSWLLFSAVMTAGIAVATLATTLAGIPLLIAAAAVIRGCAAAERDGDSAGGRRAAGLAATEVGNIAEQRALENAGFTREGVMRGIGWREGSWRDGVLYGLLRSDRREAG